ncbi:MAG: acyltransferase [Rikenellaceae bacterium]|jgi:hypothetical protein|nr:acyltransferase [Rikenellaceae bacterium]
MITPNDIFQPHTEASFEKTALEIFRCQAENCPPYKEYLGSLDIDPATVDRFEKIPHLPIEFFKSREVYTAPAPPQTVFTSSGTTGQTPGRHPIADLALYEESFFKGFQYFYGDPRKITFFALLPSYLERSGSSLVYMADRLMRAGGRGGFFLNDHRALLDAMEKSAANGEKIVLLGVTYALWELAEAHTFRFENLPVMETGGMKGRREELPREALHTILARSFGVETIHSEYGMTELLSQAYSSGGGIFRPVPWMKISMRDIYAPGRLLPAGSRGRINVIDLANLHSCSFIATQDLGTALPDGRFTVEGRIEGSEIRGCNLMVAG